MERIRNIPLFNKLSSKNIVKLGSISYFKKYSAGEILFFEGEKPGILHILVDGVLRMYKTNSKGQEIYIHQFTPSSIVGELANFENMKFPASARFITDGEVLKIDFKRLEKDFFKDPDICMEIIKSLTKKVKILSNVIHNEMILSSEAKIAKFIYEHPNVFKKIRNNQIANILNVSPETLSRTLTKLKKNSYISIDKDYNIKILNEKAVTTLFA